MQVTKVVLIYEGLLTTKKRGVAMTDEKIVDLYWARSETAISETEKKYGKLCNSISYNILKSKEDAEECVNDTYLKAWNSMPMERPQRLMPFLAKISRNLALNRIKHDTAKKRGGNTVDIALDELSDCVSGKLLSNDIVDKIFFDGLLNNFLAGLNSQDRCIFVLRYWYLYTCTEIAQKYQISESKVKVSLHRMRKSLKNLLESEGIY